MDNAAFANRIICLVLACNRPFYNKRKEQNAATFAILKRCGFVIVYLYASNALSEIKLEQLEKDTYNMTVPAPEMYEMISYKMSIAYNFFNKIHVKGILKIDDNTVISYPDIIEHDFLDLTQKYDYIGLEQVKISKDKTPYIHMVNRTKVPLLENVYHKVDIDVTYFGGPFYYLSPKALNQVTTVGLKFGYEDVSVGYAVTKNKALKQYMWNFKNKGVSWDNEKELKPAY
jgi:hypothetical protein